MSGWNEPANDLQLVQSAGDSIGKMFPAKANPLVDAYTKELMRRTLGEAHQMVESGQATAEQAHEHVRQVLESINAQQGPAPQQPQAPQFNGFGPMNPARGLGMLGGGMPPGGPQPAQAPAPAPQMQMPAQPQMQAPMQDPGTPAMNAAPQLPPPNPQPSLASAGTQPGMPPSRGDITGQARNNVMQSMQHSFQPQAEQAYNPVLRAGMGRVDQPKQTGLSRIDPSLWKTPLNQSDVEMLMPKLQIGNNQMNTGSDSMDRTLIKSGTSLQGTRQHHADLNAQLMEQDAKRGDTLSRDMLRLNDQWEIAKQKYSAMRKGQTNREAIENLKAMVAMFKQVHGDASKAAAALAMNGSSNAATEMVDEMGTYIPQMEKTIQEQMAHLETLGGNRGTVTQENEAPGTKTDPVIPTGPAGGPRGTGGDEEAKRAQPTPKLVPRKMPFGGDRPAPPSVKPGEAKKPAAPTSKPPAAGQTDVKVSSEKKQKILDAMGL